MSLTRDHSDEEREKAITERILHVLKEEGKDVRKVDWNNREVSERPNYRDRSPYSLLQASIFFPSSWVMIKSTFARNPARRGGSNAPICQGELNYSDI